MLEELAHGEADIPGDPAQENRRDVTARMKGDRGGPPVRVPELLVGALLTYLVESEPLQDRGDLPRFQNRDVAHVRLRS